MIFHRQTRLMLFDIVKHGRFIDCFCNQSAITRDLWEWLAVNHCTWFRGQLWHGWPVHRLVTSGDVSSHREVIAPPQKIDGPFLILRVLIGWNQRCVSVHAVRRGATSCGARADVDAGRRRVVFQRRSVPGRSGFMSSSSFRKYFASRPPR